jgi:hypothetical protein
MFSIASNLRLALSGLALVTAAALPSVAHADRVPSPAPRPIPGSYPKPILQFPDLVVDSPVNLGRGGIAGPQVRVRNVGTGAAAPFVLDVYVSVIPAGMDLPSGRPLYDRRPYAGLPAGSYLPVVLTGLAVRSGDTILIEGMVDATSRVGESNERNNRFSFRIPVR